MSYLCEYCKKEYSSKSSLKTHQNTTKKCIEIQNRVNSENKEPLFKCEYCGNNFGSKKGQNSHILTCSIKLKLDSILEERENNLKKEFEKQYEERIKEIEQYYEYKLKEIENYYDHKLNNDVKIARLETMNEIYQNDHKSLIEIAKQPKNTISNTHNNNKILSLQTPLDFNIDHVRDLIESKYTLEHIFDGQKGIAKFALENLLKDNDGNLKYICTDPSRQVFKYKDTYGDLQKDLEARKLTNFLFDGGIKHKACDIIANFISNNNKDKNNFDLNNLFETGDKIRNMQNDNSIFKKELAAMTTV